MRGDLHRAWGLAIAGFDVDAGDVRTFTRENLGLLGCFKKGFGGDDGASLISIGDDLLIFREAAFDQLAAQFGVLQTENDLAAAGRQHHAHNFSIVGGDAGKFVKRLTGHDGPHRLIRDSLKLRLAHREPEPIRGRHGDGFALYGDQHAGKHWAGIVSRGGEGHLLDHFLEFRNRHFDAARFIGFGHGREFLGVNAFDLSVGAAGGQMQSLGADGQLHLYGFIGEGGNQVAKGAGGNRGRPRFLDFGPQPAGDAQFAVGCRQFQAPILRR